MENLVVKRKQRQERLIAISVLAIPLVYLVVRLFLSDIFNWETPRVYLSVDYYRGHLWPWFAGWNPYGFGGHPQGYFQPFLFDWVAGGLAKLFGTVIATKLLLTAGLAILPYAIYLFLSDLGFSFRAAFIAIFLTLTCSVLFSNGWALNGTFLGALGHGRYSSLFCLPFVFLYLWAFRRGVKNFAFLILAGAFFSVVALTDISMAGVLGAMSLIAAYFYFYKMNPHKLADYFIHLGLILVLTLVWAGPYILFRDYAGLVRPPHFGFFSYTEGISFICFAIWGVVAWAASRYKRAWPEPLRFILILLAGTFLAYVVTSFIKTLQAQQFIPFLYFFGACIAGQFLSEMKTGDKILPATGALFAVSMIWFATVTLSRGQRLLDIPHAGAPTVRGLINEDMTSALYKDYSNPYQIVGAYLSQDYDVLNGLDADSTIVAPFVFGFMAEMDKNANVQNSALAPLNTANATAHARLLGLSWILSNTLYPQGPINFSVGNKLKIKFRYPGQRPLQFDHIFYVMPDNLAMFLPEAPVAYPRWTWRHALATWWKGNSLDAVPVLADEVPGTGSKPGPNEGLRFQFQSPEHYSLQIHSTQARWVYIKIPFFPDWKALQNGQQIPLYQAGPNMMAVYATGNIDLIFLPSHLEIILIVISVGAWVLTILYLVFQFLLTSAASRPRSAS